MSDETIVTESRAAPSKWLQRWQDYGHIFKQGLWHNNQALVALLGLCPLLAVSNTTANGLGLGLATLLIVVFSNGLISLIRHWVSPEIRIPVYITIIAASVTVVELLIQAYLYPLHLALGIFIPLIVTNCLILARAESYASKQPLDKALLDGFAMGLGFALALVVLGAVRELLGQGTLMADADLLLGDWATGLSIQVFEHYPGVLMAILPPGAFMLLGVMIAIKQGLNQRQTNRVTHIPVAVVSADSSTAKS